MKKHIFLLFLLLSAVSAFAGNNHKVGLAYDVDFKMKFDNREYYESNFTPSMTVFGAHLVPSLGLAVAESDGASHKVMLGADLMRDFGSDNTSGLFHELLLYYNFEKQIRQTRMEIYAGVFSRDAMEGSWSEAFFSDSLKFYDTNLEGLLLKFRRPSAYFEVGCDWMGKYSALRREKFMVFTAGEGKVLPFMSLGYAGYMLHFANSGRSKGLVDNVLVNPYVDFDLSEYVSFQKLQFRVGWLQAMQRNREYEGVFVYPFGIESVQEIRNWNVGIRNRIFYGSDMMPYYGRYDNAGLKYGPDLYYGDPFYRMHDDGRGGMGIYDRLEFYYEPFVGDFMKLRVSALFHFHNAGYSGCQQMISLDFNLERLLAGIKKHKDL